MKTNLPRHKSYDDFVSYFTIMSSCMQRAKYDIGEEAVRRFSLPPEDKAVLELAEWVAGAFRRASVFSSLGLLEQYCSLLKTLPILEHTLILLFTF